MKEPKEHSTVVVDGVSDCWCLPIVEHYASTDIVHHEPKPTPALAPEVTDK